MKLTKLPSQILSRAEGIIAALKRGTPVGDLHGKRLRFDRDLFSFPIGQQYRLVCRTTKQGIEPLRVMTHQDYDNFCN